MCGVACEARTTPEITEGGRGGENASDTQTPTFNGYACSEKKVHALEELAETTERPDWLLLATSLERRGKGSTK